MIPLSIRLKLTLWYGAALCAILAFFSAATYLRYREAAWRAFDTDLAANLDTLQGALAKEIREPKREAKAGAEAGLPDASALERRRHAAAETLDDFRLNGLYAEVRQGPGGETLLARLPGAEIGASGGLLAEAAWKETARSTATRFVPAGSGDRAAMRSFQPEPGSDPVELAVASPTTLVDQTLASIERSLIEFGTIGLVLALAGGYWLATRALQPIDAMTTQAGLMASAAPSTGSHRLEVIHADDELGRLALTFNRLLERIEASVTQLRGFIADTAHELKTPVAVVRAEAELSLSADRGPEGYRESLRAIAGESEQLSRVISDLTLLAEGETLDHPLERRLVDLKELSHEVTRSLRAVAAARSVVFDVESSGCVEYRGDERLLRQILTNLFENAIKFSRSPGRIGVVVSEEPANIEIRVLDEAPTLSVEDRVRVFDRFYRAPQPKGVAASGSGLGLAIVRWAVVLHGGTVRVEPRESGGNLFVVTLPLPTEAA